MEKEIAQIDLKYQGLEGEAKLLRKQIEGSNSDQQREKESERRKKMKDLEGKEAKTLESLEKRRQELFNKEEAEKEEEGKIRELVYEEKKEKAFAALCVIAYSLLLHSCVIIRTKIRTTILSSCTPLS